MKSNEIITTDWRTKEDYKKKDYLPKKNVVKILMTSGASCPDAVVAAVIRKITSYFGKEEALDALIKAWEA